MGRAEHPARQPIIETALGIILFRGIRTVESNVCVGEVARVHHVELAPTLLHADVSVERYTRFLIFTPPLSGYDYNAVCAT